MTATTPVAAVASTSDAAIPAVVLQQQTAATGASAHAESN